MPACFNEVRSEEMKPLTEELYDALKVFAEAEWMVTHDWGGDRDAVRKQADAALARYDAARSEGSGDAERLREFTDWRYVNVPPGWREVFEKAADRLDYLEAQAKERTPE
jgi:hypothetical protein